jgi:hypothetical protein
VTITPKRTRLARNVIRAWKHKINLNSVAWVREGTIPTERPPLVGEVSANFCGQKVPHDQRDGSLRHILGFLVRSMGTLRG